jgi:chemotaxis protein MotA
MYMELMSLLFDVLSKVRKEGLMSIEGDIDKPEEPAVLEIPGGAGRPPHHRIHDRLPAPDGVRQHGRVPDREPDGQRDRDPPPRRRGAGPRIAKLGDGLPAFGIVAAVMGVVHTMESVGIPPAELGILIAKALVGTFLGILLAYGFVGPLASLLEQKLEESTKMFQCVKVTLLASLNGYAPALAVEFGRKVLYSTERPTFAELEEHIKKSKSK